MEWRMKGGEIHTQAVVEIFGIVPAAVAVELAAAST